MATPTQNSVLTSTYSTWVFGDSLDTMLDGTKWGGARGTGVTLTYSFPQGTTYWLSPYSDNEEPDAYYGLDATQMVAARKALASLAAVANIRFVQVADNSGTVGEIRFAFTDNIDVGAAAHAYSPFDDPTAGDVWFGPDFLSDNAAPGSFFYKTMIHELGHALGLDHSFDLEPQYDNYFYTVMSYTASPWSEDGDNYASFYPTTPMYFDILALQAIYGTKGLKSNHGNTTYTYFDAPYFETIFDTGGKDTIVYAGSDTCVISLTAGSFCVLSQSIEFEDESSRSTVVIGPRTVIENARGGNQDDEIIGNKVKNKLEGRGGDDYLFGARGKDVLVGGTGADLLRGGKGKDRFDFNSTAEINGDTILDFKHKKDDIDLKNIDANVNVAGNDKFVFLKAPGSAFNSRAGELRWVQESGKTLVMGDVDGDAVADFTLVLNGLKLLTAGDFIL